MADKKVLAEPYQARRCPTCGVWVFTDAPPFGENDRTKTERDFIHFERYHFEEWAAEERAKHGHVFGIPFFNYNDDTVEAVLEEV